MKIILFVGLFISFSITLKLQFIFLCSNGRLYEKISNSRLPFHTTLKNSLLDCSAGHITHISQKSEFGNEYTYFFCMKQIEDLVGLIT